MSVPAIALYASPPSGVCQTPHHSYQIASSHGPSDFDLNPRPPSSSVASSSSSSCQKPIAGGLSCLFSSPAARHAASSSASSSFTGVDELGSLWHDRSEDLSSSFCYSSYPSSSFKYRDQSPMSVFQGPVSRSESGDRRIFGCLPCSQAYLASSYFDHRNSLLELDFHDFLAQEFGTDDLCRGLANDMNVFGLAELHRHLSGEGSHRHVVSTLRFVNQSCATKWLDSYSCEAVIIERLLIGAFADPFELQPSHQVCFHQAHGSIQARSRVHSVYRSAFSTKRTTCGRAVPDFHLSARSSEQSLCTNLKAARSLACFSEQVQVHQNPC